MKKFAPKSVHTTESVVSLSDIMKADLRSPSWSWQPRRSESCSSIIFLVDDIDEKRSLSTYHHS